MIVKLGKQVKLPTNNHFVIKYGTINALNPQSLFIAVHTWATPQHDDDLERVLQRFIFDIKSQVYDEVNYDVFYEKYIIDVDLRASGLQKDKQSFLSIDITLYPKTIIPFPADIYDSNITKLLNNLLADIKKNPNFKFAKQKLK